MGKIRIYIEVEAPLCSKCNKKKIEKLKKEWRNHIRKTIKNLEKELKKHE